MPAVRVLQPPAEFFDLLGMQARVWLWSLDAATGDLNVYTDLTEVLGANPDDLDGMLAFVHPDDREALAAQLARSVEHGEPGQLECRLMGAGGQWVHFHVSYCAAAGEGGRFTLHGVCRDISLLDAARTAGKEAIRQARLAESLAGIGYWRYTEGEGFVWSDEMYRITGLDPAQGPPTLEGTLEHCHPEDREHAHKHRLRYAGKEAPTLEIRIVRPDGGVRHVITRDTIERNEAGEQVARFGIMQDVTEIKRAEAAARESERRYRFIAENASDLIVQASPAGDIRFVSPGAEQVLGYSPEEMRALGPQAMTHPEDLPMVVEHMRGLMAGGRRASMPIRYRALHKDGSWVWIESNPRVIFDELTGAPAECIDMIRNISQAKATEAELEQARHRAEAAVIAKSAFLANMSHELRTPLTSITGFSRLMEERGGLSAEARHFTKRIRDASEALLSIINDVLDFSKLEAGQVELEPQPLAIAQLVEDTAGLVSVLADAKGVQLKLELDGALPHRLLADGVRLRQVLLNLLSNAMKFTVAGSVTVLAGYDPEGQRLRVAVEDTGPGISPEAVGRLFERFSQADVSISRTHGGTGLGLAISKSIIDLMGGRIGVDTEIGKGATFWFEIPAPPAAAAAAQEPEAEVEAEGAALRLLMVDDTAVNRELVKLMLTPLGFVIEEAEGGADGVRAAMGRPFDLILMDVRMPGVDGLEATRLIRAGSKFNRITPILALTADVQPDVAAACRAAGMDEVLSKPINPRQLLGAIARLAAPISEARTRRAAG
jgi:PAS domain S-box-containing protein